MILKCWIIFEFLEPQKTNSMFFIDNYILNQSVLKSLSLLYFLIMQPNSKFWFRKQCVTAINNIY